MILNQAELINMLTNLNQRLESVNIEIDTCPEGYLMQTYRDNKPVFFQVKSSNGIRKRKSINKNQDKIISLARKKYLEKEAEILRNDIQAFAKFLDGYIEPNPDNILKELPDRFKKLPGEYFFRQRETEEAGETGIQNSWAAEPYRQSSFKPEAKVHTTSRGLKVRSKSELMIAEKLYEHQIMFRYEQVFSIADREIIPDFTIRRADGELIYWEHCGLTGNDKYMAHHKWKLSIYEAVGVVPWKNLIVTYDDKNGNINMAVIESEIVNKLCNCSDRKHSIFTNNTTCSPSGANRDVSL